MTYQILSFNREWKKSELWIMLTTTRENGKQTINELVYNYKTKNWIEYDSLEGLWQPFTPVQPVLEKKILERIQFFELTNNNEYLRFEI